MKLKSGTYVIGDVCYLFNDDTYFELLEKSNYFTDEEIEYKDNKFVIFGTAYGDGAYHDQYKRKYYVDAGIIGCTPIELVEDFKSVNNYTHIVTFKNEFECYYDEGKLVFGDIIINTN